MNTSFKTLFSILLILLTLSPFNSIRAETSWTDRLSLTLNGFSHHSSDRSSFDSSSNEPIITSSGTFTNTASTNDDNNITPYNEHNYGAGFSYRWASDYNFHTSVGFYENSIYETSVYTSISAGKAYNFSDYYFIETGLSLGAVSGYSENITPVMALYVSYGKRGIGSTNLMYTPELEDHIAVLMLNFNINSRFLTNF